MDEVVSELESVRSELDAKDGGESTMIVKPKAAPKPRRTRASRKSFPVWPALVGALLLAAVVGGILLARGDGDPGIAAGDTVQLEGIASFDPPPGDDEEHSERVEDATDGDPATYWTTERYNTFAKSGVGLVLDAGAARQLSQIAITTDTPGFTAEIRAGDSPDGPFDTVVGSSRTVEGSATWDLEGAEARYYVVWITQLDRVAHINEALAS
jgi:hypothetical protein